MKKLKTEFENTVSVIEVKRINVNEKLFLIRLRMYLILHFRTEIFKL